MPADPEPLELFRNGYLGRPPAFAAASDPAVLLSSVADALNALERAGVIADMQHGAVMARFGYVLPAGDGRLGSRWQVRKRLWPAEPPDGSDEN